MFISGLVQERGGSPHHLFCHEKHTMFWMSQTHHKAWQLLNQPHSSPLPHVHRQAGRQALPRDVNHHYPLLIIHETRHLKVLSPALGPHAPHFGARPTSTTFLYAGIEARGTQKTAGTVCNLPLAFPPPSSSHRHPTTEHVLPQ